jgi:hypothetical protein
MSTIAQIPPYVPTNGLEGWWPFNGNANDESGNGHNGTVMGATLTTDRFGAANSAYNFTGSRIVTNYIGVLGTAARSISFWYNFNTVNNSNDLWLLAGYGGTGSCGGGFDCISWNGVNNNIGDDIRCSDAIYNTNSGVSNWHHYVATYDISFGIYTQNVKIYDNGVLQTNPTIMCCVFALNTVQNPPLQFGGNGNGPNYMDGKLDDIGFWNRVLTQSEITALYNASVGINEIGNHSLLPVFPNPITNELNVKINSNELSEIILYDISSRKLVQEKFTNSVSLNTEQIAKGVYVYEVLDKNGVFKKGKVVKD